MECHECLMLGRQHPAVAVCKFCGVGLCKSHLVELYREPGVVLQLSCHHSPASPAPMTAKGPSSVAIGSATTGRASTSLALSIAGAD